jgi:hypothetical protein
MAAAERAVKPDRADPTDRRDPRDLPSEAAANTGITSGVAASTDDLRAVATVRVNLTTPVSDQHHSRSLLFGPVQAPLGRHTTGLATESKRPPVWVHWHRSTLTRGAMSV